MNITPTPANTFYRDAIRNTFSLDALRAHLVALERAAPGGSPRAENADVAAFRRCIEDSIANHAAIVAAVNGQEPLATTWLRLANRDERQPWRTKPGAPESTLWVPVLNTAEACRVVRGYVTAFDVARVVAWAGGELVEHDTVAADVNHHGELVGMKANSRGHAEIQKNKEARTLR